MLGVSLADFANKMNEIMPIIIKEFSKRHTSELYKGNITLPQLLILNYLNKKEEGKMTDLAKFMGVTTAAMTGITDRLVRGNYVVRNHDTKDRRVINIKLTSKGVNLVKRINQQRREMVIKIFGKISQPERENYLNILMRIRDILIREKIQGS